MVIIDITPECLTFQTFIHVYIIAQAILVTLGSHLLSYYLANKRSFYVLSQGLEILTLIEKNKKNNYPSRPL